MLNKEPAAKCAFLHNLDHQERLKSTLLSAPPSPPPPPYVGLPQLDLVNLGLLIKGPGGGRGQGVVVEQLDLVKGRGIGTDHRVAGERGRRHGGRGTLLDQQNTVDHLDVDWKPVTPAKGENANIIAS